MKVLLATARFPYPPLRGDQSLSFHRLKYLGKRHAITLLSFYGDDSELRHLDELRPYCAHIELVRRRPLRALGEVGVAWLRGVQPLQVAFFRDPAFAQRLQHLRSATDFDLVHVFTLRMASYFLELPGPKLIELIDSMALNFSRRAAGARGPRGAVYRLEQARLAQYEPLVVQRFDASVVVSHGDRQWLPAEGSHVIPLGIDGARFSPRLDGASGAAGPRRIVFSGNMVYEPNIEAVHWFVQAAWPTVRQAFPDVELRIVGNRPPRSIRRMERLGGVRVTGRVPSMADELRSATLAVAPMRSGSGMQFKILEAMACGLPVVTTTLGLGSIRATPGEELLVADSGEAMASCVVALLRDSARREQLGQRARRFVELHHTHEREAAQVEALYETILRAGGAAVSA
jgi:sugar transferase (PEP-CTERM/EpsH1 system associated)